MGRPDDAPADAGAALTLHSGWFGLVGSTLGAAIVLAVGVLAVTGVGMRVIPVVVLVVGAGLTLGVLLDYPVAARFTAAGVQRRPLLRRHTITWDRIEGLSRARPGFRATSRAFVPGGLVAVVGRRRYLLVDRPESGAEYDRMSALMRQWGVDLPLGPRPSDEIAPTWLYRRRRWRPSDAPDR